MYAKLGDRYDLVLVVFSFTFPETVTVFGRYGITVVGNGRADRLNGCKSYTSERRNQIETEQS
jgi:ABC-type xylose transport system permease subunit